MLSQDMELQGIGAPVPDWLKGLIRAVRHEAIKPKDARVKSLWDLLRQRQLLRRSRGSRRCCGVSGPGGCPLGLIRARRVGSCSGCGIGDSCHRSQRVRRLIARATRRPLAPAAVQAMRPVALKPVASVRPAAMQPVRPVQMQPAAMKAARK